MSTTTLLAGAAAVDGLSPAEAQTKRIVDIVNMLVQLNDEHRARLFTPSKMAGYQTHVLLRDFYTVGLHLCRGIGKSSAIMSMLRPCDVVVIGNAALARTYTDNGLDPLQVVIAGSEESWRVARSRFLDRPPLANIAMKARIYVDEPAIVGRHCDVFGRLTMFCAPEDIPTVVMLGDPNGV